MSQYLPLLLAILGLFVGPALYAVPHWRSWDRVLDSFTVAVVGGLCVLHLLPDALEHGGWGALAMAGVGLGLLRFLHRLQGAGPWVLLAGLIAHAALESAAMAGPGRPTLGIAVVLHRLPVGLAVFTLYHEHPRTHGLGWVAIGALALATAAGFFVGPALLTATGETAQAALEATVAGMLLHVVWGHGDHGHGGGRHDHGDHDHTGHGGHDHTGHGDHDHTGHGDPAQPAPRIDLQGLRIAVAALFGITLVTSIGVLGHDHTGHSVLDTALSLTLESAPALVIAYVLAGVLMGLGTPRTSAWLARGGRPTQALKGVAFGLPLPICSCGVLPMYEALVRRGVPATAAVGFLIATPELGIDAILISIPLLGTKLTVARALAAFVVALGIAWGMGAAMGPPRPVDMGPSPPGAGTIDRLKAGLRFGLVELVDHTLPWVILGLLVAAFAQPLLASSLLVQLPPWLQVPVFALIGIPVYVCASGATPIAAVAISQGISPGAALAFLLAGPATNITTFGVLSQLHGRRIAITFGAAVTVAAVSVGWTIDALTLSIPMDLATTASHGPSVLQIVAVLALGGLGVGSLVRQGPRGMVGQILDPIHAH